MLSNSALPSSSMTAPLPNILERNSPTLSPALKVISPLAVSSVSFRRYFLERYPGVTTYSSVSSAIPVEVLVSTPLSRFPASTKISAFSSWNLDVAAMVISLRKVTTLVTRENVYQSVSVVDFASSVESVPVCISCSQVRSCVASPSSMDADMMPCSQI